MVTAQWLGIDNLYPSSKCVNMRQELMTMKFSNILIHVQMGNLNIMKVLVFDHKY